MTTKHYTVEHITGEGPDLPDGWYCAFAKDGSIDSIENSRFDARKEAQAQATEFNLEWAQRETDEAQYRCQVDAACGY
jgi:hypothetical protein